MERLSRKDALNALNFSEVARPFDDALATLTAYSRASVRENMILYATQTPPEAPGRNEFLAHWESSASEESLNKLQPGGMSFIEEDLRSLYEDAKSRNMTYGDIIRDFIGQFSKIEDEFKSSSRSPGVVFTGFLFDLGRIVSPAIATQEEVREFIAGELITNHRNRLTPDPFVIGACLDDTRKMVSGANGNEFDFFADRKEAELFYKTYRRKCNLDEVLLLEEGLRVTEEELVANLYGISLSPGFSLN